MFEKSLYDLIRGLRNHKGNEKEYIQTSLKECRSEIRSQDMDVKATALLKLVYLEMLGHDMSWASFHVLEVMSSQKYHQKRVGYLAAVQSFRPDTDVLMMATNLLKKDVAASLPIIISLPIGALPHIVTPSLAMSLLGDLLPRLGHSHAAIRKKTVVTLYRLALVYPEALRASWPKIKERLMDPEEDSSVTAAIVNVVCELGWRRPHDFLPLAPRLFELLVDGGNNWMAIKLIKLFATLTPLEPRLVRKLLPPLTNLIRTTPAMSLLYECINGIIQGGILGDGEDFSAREEVASLCVTKLRGMVSASSDPNLKYVALLAFNRIVVTHPFLVAQQEDVILECIDSEDITIRIKALDLVQGMVSSDNLVTIVSRLMRQLKASSTTLNQQQNGLEGQGLETDSSDEGSADSKRRRKALDRAPPLPDNYTVDVIGRILMMCTQNNYANIVDFDWYIDVISQLLRVAPAPRAKDLDGGLSPLKVPGDISEKIGNELRNVAVKVKAIRAVSVRAAELVVSRMGSEISLSQPVVSGALKPIAWVLGEYASQLLSPDDSLRYLLDIVPRIGDPEVLATCLQAVLKLFAHVSGDDQALWTSERKSTVSLLMARIIHVLEPFSSHPYLEVQERAVEFIELLKLTAEAAAGQATSTDEVQQDPPLLLTQAIPSLFAGWELNSVAAGTQQNVPVPDDLDLDEPIHPNLNSLLAQADSLMLPVQGDDEFEAYYNEKPPATSMSSEPAIKRLVDAPEEVSSSYQQSEESYLDSDIIARRKAERMERYRDDPFYIPDSTASGGRSTPIHNILQKENGPDLDIDSIPIMQLDLDKPNPQGRASPAQHQQQQLRPKSKPNQRIVVAADETLGGSGLSTPRTTTYDSEHSSEPSLAAKSRTAVAKKLKQHSLLQITSSHLSDLALGEEGAGQSGGGGPLAHERQQREEAEMAQALKEVQRLRLEMQRANERIQIAQGVPVEGVVVRKKKTTKKVVKADEGQREEGIRGGEGLPEGEGVKPKTKKKKKVRVEGQEGAGGGNGEPVVKAKKKVKKVVQLNEGEGAAAAAEGQ
ncbi:Adaptor protein complex AP-3 delta subunit [Parathielavia appendiculata]|uniref:AP-3 complex subunit delta n=1 Tax=Parathielavia appendiculata TaxID=2587402 RepID=A0AAN6TX34_9PEZI|nr:Adaptor protein complex AP-3 delta subunit [Parathielavia appendiculata]